MKPSQLIIALAIALFASLQLKAQQYEDVVHLNNGSVYRGMIIEQIPNESLKIQIMGGSVIAVSMKEVSKLTKEEAFRGATLQRSPKQASMREPREKVPFEARTKGYFFQGQIMMESMQGGLRIVNGYKFGRFGHVGIGLGFDGVGGSPANGRLNGLSNSELSGLYLPFYVYYAGDILRTKVTPFYAIEAGYAHPVKVFGGGMQEDFYYGEYSSTNIEGGGVMGAAGIGVRFNTRKRINFSLLLNVNFKNVQYSENYYIYDEYYGVSDYYSTGVRNATLIHGGLRFGIGF